MTDALLVILIIITAWNGWEFRRLRRKLVIVSMLLASSSQAQPKIQGPPRPVELTKLLTPADAYALAWADLQTLPSQLWPTTRYIWLQEPSVDRVKSLSATLNRISRASVTFRPVPLADNRMLRFDLSRLSYDVDVDITELIGAWEQLRFDPRFNLLLTPDTIKVVLSLPKEAWPTVLVRDGGKFVPYALDKLDKVDVVRALPDHLDHKTVLSLHTACQSAAPVISADYFEYRCLSQIQGTGPYRTIFGGLYYQMKGIKKSTKKDQTDLDLLLEQLGATGKRLAEQRVGLFKSGVTGKPRAVDFLPATNRRVGDGPAAVVITSDPFDESIDVTQHAIMTLGKAALRPDGFEVIYIDANGLNAYALYNGKKELVDEAPPNLVADSTIPRPHTQRLQPAISCIRCHEAEGSDGWKPVANDVQTLVDRGLDIFGDANSKSSFTKTVQELAAAYKGRPQRFLVSARNAYQSAILECTGPYEKSKATDVLKLTSANLEKSYNSYWYDPITPARALTELGFAPQPRDHAPLFLRRLLAPDARAQVYGIIPEDVRIGALVLDMPIGRVEWSLVNAYAQSRANRELNAMKEKR